MTNQRYEPRVETTDPDRTWSYVAVLAIETVVVIALWALGRHFSG
ncbi:MAG TPA: hypothetical protein VK911_12700 [Vicinamibacterales bacterium]|nr:hypothetical protein [Vicinamibacterales bacterium]